jgi:hypothetical protein
MDRARLLTIGLACLALAACEDAPHPDGPPERPSGGPRAATTAPSSSDAPGASAAPVTGSAAPTGSATAPGLSGVWEGKYDAKKGEIALPPKVPEKTWKKDDGKTAAGAGSITLTIGPSGEVTGQSTGALGDLDLTGRVEGSIVRASVMPKDPTAPPSMTGVLVGMLKGDVIQADLKAAGPDASIVREAKVELRKKP